MSSLVGYINSWWYVPESIHENTMVVPTPPPAPVLKSNSEPSNNIVYLVSVNELLSVKLKPVTDIIPSPARNMPHINKFQLHMLNQAQLKAILSVKLKPVKLPIEPKKYPPRHPVLRELLLTRKLKH
jgi:hypothetical protein